MMPHQESIKMLRRLGQRRQRLQQANERLAEDIRLALEVTEGDVSRVDAAHLLGLDRTTLYTVYINNKSAR